MSPPDDTRDGIWRGLLLAASSLPAALYRNGVKSVLAGAVLTLIIVPLIVVVAGATGVGQRHPRFLIAVLAIAVVGISLIVST